MGSRCRGCGEASFPPRADCAACMGRDVRLRRDLGPRHVLHSFTDHRRLAERLRRAGAYTLGLVDLEEGGRALAGFGETIDAATIAIGMPLQLVPFIVEDSEEIKVLYRLERPGTEWSRVGSIAAGERVAAAAGGQHRRRPADDDSNHDRRRDRHAHARSPAAQHPDAAACSPSCATRWPRWPATTACACCCSSPRGSTSRPAPTSASTCRPSSTSSSRSSSPPCAPSRSFPRRSSPRCAASAWAAGSSWRRPPTSSSPGEGASFGQPEIMIGVSPPVACAFLPGLCSPGLAAELVLTGDAIDAAPRARGRDRRPRGRGRQGRGGGARAGRPHGAAQRRGAAADQARAAPRRWPPIAPRRCWWPARSTPTS